MALEFTDIQYGEPLFVERQPSRFFAAIAIITLSFIYFGLGNDWNTPKLDVDNFQLDASDVEEQAEEGRNIWRLAFLGIGIVGIGLLVIPGGRRPRVGSILSLAIIAAAGWALLSVTWSDYPLLTLRRVMGLYCITLGALGFAKHFSTTHACVLAVTYGTVVMLASIAAELGHGTFAPWDGAYRFAGTAHPNQTAIRMTLLSICAMTLARHYWKWRPLLIAIFLTAFALVFFSKSRSSLGAAVFSLAAIWALDATPRFKIVTTIAGSVLAFVLLATVFAAGIDGLGTAAEFVSLGRDGADEDPTSFTGRVPLWEYAIDHIKERPLLGYGFNSYWSDEQLADAHYELEWALPDAHNAYIEITLGLGLIGISLVLIMIAIGIFNLSKTDHRIADNGVAGVFGVCAFGALNGFFESHMLQPFNFTPFIVACAFFRIAFFPDPVLDEQTEDDSRLDESDVVWEAAPN